MTRLPLHELNPPQRQAVLHGDGPMLVLAGAGSGKPRVITYRIAHLIDQGVEPGAIMAVTFTNKAAQEMRERITKLLGKEQAGQVWIGTFHALCLRILKIQIPHEFSIYDDEESKRLLKECQRELNLDEKTMKVDQLAYRIESAKHELVDAEEFSRLASDFATKLVAKVYTLYQQKLARNHAFDFGDLIMAVVKLFQAQPEIREKYERKFRHILVDEYQDINHCQYFWIRQLAGESGNLTVVGDDDQSIYQFRGADLRNILEFERDFPAAIVIKLEQNYRSTQTILAAATAVVKNNHGRKDKTLWTENSEGVPIQYFRGETEADEASFVVKEIGHDVYYKRMRKLEDCVILYRTNAQSRPFEDALRRDRVPYRIIGGMKFYDRMEIKDVLAYLKIIANPSDELSLSRIVNTPPRGLGAGALGKLQELAASQGMTMFQAMEHAGQTKGLIPDRAAQAAREFSNLINDLRNRQSETDLARFLIAVVNETGYLHMWQSAPYDEGNSRVENINELIQAADEFAHREESGEGTLKAFLEQIALVSSWDENDNNNDQVTLMTFHSAKGLEFPLVFMVGMEEGLFPHSNALQDEHGLDEERRLCYVGITRARERLVMTGAATRTNFGNRIYNSESRFLHEIPAKLFSGTKPLAHQKAQVKNDARGLWKDREYDETRFNQETAIVDEPSAAERPDEPEAAGLSLGQKVRHAKYGVGTVVGKLGEGDDMKIEIAFLNHGRKKMIARFAALQPVGPGAGKR